MNQIKIIKTITAILVLLAAENYSSAQYVFPDKAQCEILKGRTLAVKLFDETKSEYQPYNDAIRKGYNEEWKITPVEFVSKEKYEEIVRGGDTKYAVVYHGDVTNLLTQERVNRETNMVLASRSFTFEHYDVLLKIVTGFAKLSPVTSISFCNGDLMPGEFFFAAQQLQLLVDASLNDRTEKKFYDAEKNIEYIKSKKFLLPKELFKEKDLGKIGDKYEFPFEISDFAGLDKIVLSKNEDYVYPKIIWSNQHRAYGWITISAKDGSVRSFMAFSGLRTGTNEKPNEILKPGQLNNALSGFMQKVNNKYD